MKNGRSEEIRERVREMRIRIKDPVRNCGSIEVSIKEVVMNELFLAGS